VKLLIIGAGVVGSNIAYRLARAGAQVTVLDAGRPGGGTSGATFAWLNAFTKTPRHYFDLNVASMREHGELARELQGEWYTAVGGLAWGRDEAKQSSLRANAERLTAWGYPAELLSPRQAHDLEPDLVFEPDDEIIFVPGEGWVAPVPLIYGALRAAESLGATVRAHTRVVEVLLNGQRATGVRTEAGERLEADVLVDCAGPWSDEVAALAGVRLPLTRHPGQLAYSPPVATGLRRVCHSPEVHFRPDSGGRIVIGQAWHDDNLTPDSPNALPPQALLDRAAVWLPALRGATVEAARIGVRPIPEDGFPLLGFLPGLEGFYTAVMHSGVTLGPLVGKLVAGELVEGRVDPLLLPYRPSRFSA
jgi:glycine/D-amino acid oxidase-like deaminating enzyme